ncbi:hypothetical protein DCC81_11960 [Chitinophaga parva]|uniref:Uncharacterized protein n=1 Tax=Chitinophaga parva TaxID=2169414 RepID=A0A2T7BFF9_9BACT|nr:hypothetical protein [Chitinophaga parva]PUZ25022.1 hypothetical protein DCC81_11960 [Chitinophaga parva]
MEDLKLAPKDAKIYRENPGKTPYELKELGLSNPAFERLMAQTSTNVTVIADPNLEAENASNNGGENQPALQPPANEPPAQTSPTPGAPLQPSASAPALDPNNDAPAQPSITNPRIGKITNPSSSTANSRHGNLKPNQVWVQGPDGRVNPMGREFAVRLARQNAGYKII